MEMEELTNDADYQAFMAQEEQEAKEEGYGMDNMEPNKAKEFARKVAAL